MEPRFSARHAHVCAATFCSTGSSGWVCSGIEGQAACRMTSVRPVSPNGSRLTSRLPIRDKSCWLKMTSSSRSAEHFSANGTYQLEFVVVHFDEQAATRRRRGGDLFSPPLRCPAWNLVRALDRSIEPDLQSRRVFGDR